MKKNIVIGADVGGSHITSAAVDLENLQILEGSLFSKKVNNKASKESILAAWSIAINQSIKSAGGNRIHKNQFCYSRTFSI